jgi:long-chain fatty acid transport protein
MNKMTLRTLPGLLLLAFAGATSAAGFQIQEQDASGIATSFAGSAAVAENASTNFYNPAGLTQLPGLQISVGGVGLKSNIESGQFAGNAAGGLVLPNFYFAAPLTRDLYFGFGISRPFGVTAEYNAGWAGDALARKTEINTLNYNPSLAYRLNDKVSLGLGLNYQKLNAEFSIAGLSQTGNDSAFGWNAGALFTLSPAMRVGLAYRSAVDYRLKGNLNGDLKLPGTFTLSVWQQVSDNWEAMGDLSFTQWNRFDRSTVGLANTGADYRNAWRFAWGAAYKNNDSLKTKFGLAFDRSATRNGDVNLRVPEYNHLWLSVGAQWMTGSAGKVDLGYAYKISRDVNFSAGAVNGQLETGSHVLGLQYSAGF